MSTRAPMRFRLVSGRLANPTFMPHSGTLTITGPGSVERALYACCRPTIPLDRQDLVSRAVGCAARRLRLRCACHDLRAQHFALDSPPPYIEPLRRLRNPATTRRPQATPGTPRLARSPAPRPPERPAAPTRSQPVRGVAIYLDGRDVRRSQRHLGCFSWKPADVRSSGFGISITPRFTATKGNDRAHIDSVRATARARRS